MKSACPTIISFYTTNSPYYVKHGERFIKRINQLNPHGKFDVDVEKKDWKLSWSDACCKKQEFIRDKLIEHGKILWIDIDTHIERLPTEICEYDLSVGWEKHFRVTRGESNINPDMVLCDVCYAQNDSCSRAFFDELIENLKNVKKGGDHGSMLDTWYKFRMLTTCQKFDFIDASWRKIGISGNELTVDGSAQPHQRIDQSVFRNRNKIRQNARPIITKRTNKNPRRKR